MEAQQTNQSHKPALNRHIGLIALTLYGVGDILGAGVYGLVGKAAGQMGNAVWLAFLASMIAAGLTGLSYASLGSRYPKAGGASYITHKAYGKAWLAYGVGLAVLASGLTSMATGTRVFSGYFQGLVGGNIPLPLIMLGFAGVLAFIVFWGIRESMWANIVCTVIELSGLLLVVVVGYSFIGSVDLLDTTTAAIPNEGIAPSLILSGAVLTFFSFVGFEDILNVSEEVKNPQHTLPRGLLLAVGISSVIYMLISIIAVSVIPASDLAASKEPLVDVVRKAAPWFPTSIYSIIAMFAVSNTALLNFIMGSRLVYGMANQGLLPKSLGKVHQKRHTPHIAAGAIFVILLVLAFSGDISSLAKATSVLLLLCFMLVNAALVILKHRKSEPKGAFEVPTFVPVLGAMVCACMVVYAQGPELTTAGIILGSIAVLYFVIRPKEAAIVAMEEEHSLP
ncbi:MAG TPA: APC family permease [Bdellovibrionales bacterium]|nr:APC family permease [Bdellovibrionales bacterium]